MARRLRAGSLAEVRGSPTACGNWLSSAADLWGVSARVALHDRRVTVFHVVVEPPPGAISSYPIEQTRITVTTDGRVFAVPVAGDDRRWLHRYWHLSVAELLDHPIANQIAWEHLLGSLCLWYPEDPDHLRWNWSHGIDGYIRVVQRHLWSEEYWRRHGRWPSEDAPHGRRGDGRPHPIHTAELRIA